MKKVCALIEESFHAMKNEGFAMRGATVILKDGTRFKYKIQELPSKKIKKERPAK